MPKERVSKKIMIIPILITLLIFSGLSPCYAAKKVASKKKTTHQILSATSSLPVNVKDFGAKGNGTADDSAAIQKAFNSIKEKGAVYFPKGTYVIEKTIVIPSNIRITGESKRAAVILYKGTDKAFVSGDRVGKYGNGSYYITIEDITFQGNDAGIGLYITSRYLSINNAEISHFGVGVDAQFCWTNKFYNVSIFHNAIGFKGGSFLNANSFVNCIFAGGQTAVTVTQGWNISFVGCQFESFSGACFSFNGDSKNAVWNLSITGCYFENEGRTIDAGPNCSFFGLAFSNNIVTTHGTNLAINVDNANAYGKNTGLVENNTFIRDNNGGAEPFIHLNGPAYLTFRANQGYAAPGNIAAALFDESTVKTNSTYIEETLADGNKRVFSGTGVFNKGVIVGSGSPIAGEPGLIVYDNGNLKLFCDTAESEYLQTVKTGPRDQRPANPYVGMVFFDTTLNRPIWWNGKDWIDAGGWKKP